MFRKIGVLKIWKKSLKICFKELILNHVKASSLQLYYRMNSFTCNFKGFTYILMTFLVFSIIFWNTDLQKISYCNRKQNCSIKAGFRQSAINHQKILKMFEAKMLENFLWKSSAIVKLQFYTNSSQKHLF